MNTDFDEVMARIDFRYVSEPNEVTEDDLDKLEQEIGYSLPTDYRIFLQKYGFVTGNGNIRFSNPDNCDEIESSIDVFYGLKRGNGYDIRKRKAIFSDRLPKHLLPFASGAGGEFCISLSGDDVGHVYWWFQETGPVESLDDLEPIADTFGAFVNSLVCVDE